MNYYYKKEVPLTFHDAIERTKSELAKEGFGVLTEVDIKATFKKKIDKEYDNYIILGACNPSFAYEALLSEKDIGLLLPCNVLVYEEGGKVFVSAIVPTIAMSMVKNELIEQTALLVEGKLKNAVDAI